MEVIELLCGSVTAIFLKYCLLANVFSHVTVMIANPVSFSDYWYLIT
jgi:hypothetical protein